jgi:hypothetical protein
MAHFKELEISGGFFEPVASAEEIRVPLIREYPNPSNTFDVFLGNDGTQQGGNTQQRDNTQQGEGFDVGQAIEFGTQVVGAIVQNQDGTKKELRQVCGRRPLFKKRRGEYDACRERYYTALQGLSGSVSNDNMQYEQKEDEYNDEKKGISAPVVIGIVLGVLAIGTAIYFVTRKK